MLKYWDKNRYQVVFGECESENRYIVGRNEVSALYSVCKSVLIKQSSLTQVLKLSYNLTNILNRKTPTKIHILMINS